MRGCIALTMLHFLVFWRIGKTNVRVLWLSVRLVCLEIFMGFYRLIRSVWKLDMRLATSMKSMGDKIRHRPMHVRALVRATRARCPIPKGLGDKEEQ